MGGRERDHVNTINKQEMCLQLKHPTLTKDANFNDPDRMNHKLYPHRSNKNKREEKAKTLETSRE